MYRVDAREGSPRERFIAAVTADDFIEADAFFDALPPPDGIAGWLCGRTGRRVDLALGDSLAITLRPSRSEVFATWFGRRGLRGAWRSRSRGASGGGLRRSCHARPGARPRRDGGCWSRAG
ncbi:MAG: hypothetical protein R3A52_14295 [Polyangiales bacterium]